MYRGEELPYPGQMSFTMTVPAAVPSLVQSSLPYGSRLAAKKSRPFALTRYPASYTSASLTVPAGVPSLFQMA